MICKSQECLGSALMESPLHTYGIFSKGNLLKDLLIFPKDLPISLCNSLRTSVSFFLAGLQDLHNF